jgi:2-haloacid dehalogenase
MWFELRQRNNSGDRTVFRLVKAEEPTDSRAAIGSTCLTRRRTLKWFGAACAAVAVSPIMAKTSVPNARRSHTFEAIAFDAFAVFDPRPVFAACEREFPGHGAELALLWRTRQFEYQWLRALGSMYADFEVTAADALEFACASVNLELTAVHRDALMSEFLRLRAWPDVAAALNVLRERGLQTALLSNATPRMLEAAIANSSLAGAFDHVISTDRIHSFKPDPRAYQLGVDVLGVGKREIAFVASAGWDAAGARWFGYPTYWNNRVGAVGEKLGGTADRTGPTLDELVQWVGESSRGSNR